ncbi:hypothetical protein [Streptomyces tendae]|uniref:hypothetical protein n=1 Tax=Streptomyces tendae TaxID=1932 RepID=UPI00132FB2C1|nr:hypothetical protein [Streptomyces tendae]
MRQQLSMRSPGIVVALLAPGVALLLAGCGSGGDDEAAPERPSASRTSASADAPSPDPDTTPPTESADTSSAPADPAPDTSDLVDEAFGAARVAALQSGLRYIDPALGAPEDVAKADAQCADLQRNVAEPDQVAAQRFSTGDHTVTKADGKRINTLLRNTYCGR